MAKEHIHTGVQGKNRNRNTGGEQTISEIASRGRINVNQLKNWKKDFLRMHPRPLMVQNQKRKQKEQLRTQKVGKKSLCRKSVT